MPGLVKAILVKPGQEVKVGEPLCMVEAMKMENVLRAERDGTISKIQRQGRRQPRGRRRHHGIRLNHAALLRLRVEHGSRCHGGTMPGLEGDRHRPPDAAPLHDLFRRLCVGRRAIPPARPGGCYGIFRSSDMPALDRYESLSTGLYTKVIQPIVTGPGAAPRHRLYWPRRGSRASPKPGYHGGIVEAAEALGLPANYLAELNAWNPSAAGHAGSEDLPCGRSGLRPRAHCGG